MIAMNASRWNWTIIGLVGCALVLYGISNPAGLSHTDVEADEPNYSLSFTSTTNRFSTSATETTGTAMTTESHPLSFTYNKLNQTGGTWETVSPGGYCYNTTPISGLKTITFVFGNANGIILSYGWADRSTGVITYQPYKEPLNSITNSYTFNDQRPDCFKVENTSTTLTASITSFTLTYSCFATIAPTDPTFGSYPQSKVIDETLIATLNGAAGTLPVSGNNRLWTDYGYYISGAVSSYMWYIDLTSELNQYRGVYFTSYRPNRITTSSSSANSYQDDNGYSLSTVYWFKYEPITWRVLDVQAGKSFLMADLILDSQDYNFSSSIIYESSHIRSWLNDNFYNTAFTNAEKTRIQTTAVDNSVASTGYNPNPYACNDTNDSLFLLSYLEFTSSSYGLDTTSARLIQTSAYSQAQGANTYTNTCGYWWSRSPTNTDAVARWISFFGNVAANNVDFTYGGVVPALWITL